MAASIVHIPLAPMTLEINAVSSEYVTWTFRWRNVDLSSDVETYSQNFGHPDGWIWRMLFQTNVDANGNRFYGIFLCVVMNDNELQERSWTRDIRFLQFLALNSEGRELRDKTTVAMYRENQTSWGYPGMLNHNLLMRDPVVSQRRTIDIVCRLRYHPAEEKMRRSLSPSIPGGLLGGSLLGASHPAARAASSPGSYWDQKASTTAVADSVGRNLRKLINNRDFSDLELIVGPDRHVFQGHRAILAARSDWFRSALRPEFREAREGRIVLAEDDPKIFEALLEFLYTGEYPLSKVDPIRTTMSTSQDPVHFSPRSPPHGDDPMSNSAFNTQPMEGQSYDYLNQYNTEEDEDVDEPKYMLFLMADKYGVSELKNMIRLHLSNDLLDISSNVQPGPRLLRLIRFAFEELPEATTPPGDRDSAMAGGLLSTGLRERIDTPPTTPGYPNGYPFRTSSANSFQASELENREGTASAFGHSVPTSGDAMKTDGGPASGMALNGGRSDDGIYGRDNETALLRESITAYVAKMFHVVRKLEGFDDLLKDLGFVKMVMDYMYRP